MFGRQRAWCEAPQRGVEPHHKSPEQARPSPPPPPPGFLCSSAVPSSLSAGLRGTPPSPAHANPFPQPTARPTVSPHRIGAKRDTGEGGVAVSIPPGLTPTNTALPHNQTPPSRPAPGTPNDPLPPSPQTRAKHSSRRRSALPSPRHPAPRAPPLSQTTSSRALTHITQPVSLDRLRPRPRPPP